MQAHAPCRPQPQGSGPHQPSPAVMGLPTPRACAGFPPPAQGQKDYRGLPIACVARWRDPWQTGSEARGAAGPEDAALTRALRIEVGTRGYPYRSMCGVCERTSSTTSGATHISCSNANSSCPGTRLTFRMRAAAAERGACAIAHASCRSGSVRARAARACRACVRLSRRMTSRLSALAFEWRE